MVKGKDKNGNTGDRAPEDTKLQSSAEKKEEKTVSQVQKGEIGQDPVQKQEKGSKNIKKEPEQSPDNEKTGGIPTVKGSSEKDDNKTAEDGSPPKDKKSYGTYPKRRSRDFDEEEKVWEPKTRMGKKVKSGLITSIHEVMLDPSPIKEVEIVDTLLPDMEEEVLDVGRVQRVTDSGRRMRFRVVAATGNNDGYIGVGQSKGKEAGPTIRKSIVRAKLNIIEIKRGCGSWECGCGQAHTVPFEVTGKAGSVKVTLKPAPRGVGIVSGKLARTVLSLAGITDVWVETEGHSRTGINFAHAVMKALKSTNDMKLKKGDDKKLHIVTGATKKNQKPEPIPEATQ